MKKRILYFHQYFRFPDVSGGTRSYDLAKKFLQAGHDVTVICSKSGFRHVQFSGLWKRIEAEGINVWILNNDYEQSFSIPKRILSFFIFVLFSTIKSLSIKSDVVIATSTPLTIAIPAIFKKWFSGTPYIFEVRDVWPEGPIQQGFVTNPVAIRFLRWFESFVYNRSSYVVALSTGMKRCILSRIELKNIAVIPNISEIERFKDRVNYSNFEFDFEGKKVVLYAGTCGLINHIMYVAEMALHLIDINPKIVFLVIGKGSKKEEIVEFCQRSGILNKNIFFYDSIPKKGLPYVYSRSTMGSSFVWDYRIKWDNSANKFFDTLAAGKPILINYDGWQAEVIKERNCGYILPPQIDFQSSKLFADYIVQDDLLARQGRNALLLAQERYSLEIASESYLQVLDAVDLSRKQTQIN